MLQRKIEKTIIEWIADNKKALLITEDCVDLPIIELDDLSKF